MPGTVGIAPGTTTLVLPDGSVIALADWIDDKFFGAAQFNNGDSGQREVFQNGRSQQIPGGTRTMTSVDTNVPRTGDSGLPKDWEFLNYGWGIGITRVERPNLQGNIVLADGNGALSNPPTYNTWFQFDRVTAFDYQYNNKSYTTGVPTDYPQGQGLFTFATTSAFEIAGNGIPSPRDRVALVLPVHERENLSFRAIFSPQVPLVIQQAASDGATTLSALDVKVWKRGLIKRTVV